jgi:hypothetical protein
VDIVDRKRFEAREAEAEQGREECKVRGGGDSVERTGRRRRTEDREWKAEGQCSMPDAQYGSVDIVDVKRFEARETDRTGGGR